MRPRGERRRWVPGGTDRSDAEGLGARLGIVEADGHCAQVLHAWCAAWRHA
jgi:hypothetical protein